MLGGLLKGLLRRPQVARATSTEEKQRVVEDYDEVEKRIVSLEQRLATIVARKRSEREENLSDP